MIIEEIIPHRIRDLIAACEVQHDMVLRLIVEVEPGFHDSRLRILLDSRRWPYAVNPNLIIDSNSLSDQKARANAIIDQFFPPGFTGKNVLDFGCGAGTVTQTIRHRGNQCIGYDIDTRQFAPSEGLTNSWDTVTAHKPYDAILVYDVFDHSKDEHPIDCLKKIRSVLAENGKVYVRCHPWCSRTGMHAYTSINKAYIHYFFTEDQLEDMGVKTIWTRKITHPIITYDDWFLKAGFKKITEDVRREPLEPIWEEEPLLKSLAQHHWRGSYDEGLANGTKFPKHQMEQQFHDFTLILS